MKKQIIQIVSAFILFIIALCVKFENIWITRAIYLIGYLIVGGEIILKAIKNIFKGELFDEHFLMAVATIGAIAIGEYPEAVAVMLFYQVGELFQDYAVDKSKKSITELMNIRPDYANVKRNENITKVNPEKVKIGENSRKVWHVLNEMKRISIQELCSRTNLAIEDAMLAIGWLARENSIFIEKRENTIYLSNGSEYHFCFG